MVQNNHMPNVSIIKSNVVSNLSTNCRIVWRLFEPKFLSKLLLVTSYLFLNCMERATFEREILLFTDVSWSRTVL